jgi:F-type H+-transporting ATPase subunit epsilon
MPLTTHLDIVSAEALIYSGPATKVVLPAEDGEICVLARHAPLLTRLRPGLVRLANEFEVEQTFFISSGFVEVQPHIVTVLADTVTRTKDLDEAAARAAMERTRESIAAAHPSGADYDKLMVELKMELALLRAIDQLRRQTKR